MTRKKRQFSREFKAQVIRLVIDGGRSCSDIARRHNLAQGLRAGWVRQARIDNGENNRAKSTSAEKEELTRLRKALRESEMENAFLKKTSAVSTGQRNTQVVRVTRKRDQCLDMPGVS